MPLRREGGCFRCERTPETRKLALWNILFTKFCTISFSGFRMSALNSCVDNNGLRKVTVELNMTLL